MKLLLNTLFLSLIFFTTATAHAGTGNGLYVGAGYTFIGDNDNIKSVGRNEPIDVTLPSSSGIKVFAGYAFNQFFDIELAYIDLGESQYRLFDTVSEVDERDNNAKLVTANVQKDISRAYEGLSTSFVGTYPLTNRVDIYAKLGFIFGEINEYETISVINADELSEEHRVFRNLSSQQSGENIDAVLGVGVSYWLKSWKISVAAESYHFRNEAIDVANLNVAYYF